MANKGFLNKQKIYERIEERTGIPKNEVEEAVKHQFSRTAELMASGNRETKEFAKIRLQYFGLFKANKKRIKHLQKHSNNNDSD